MSSNFPSALDNDATIGLINNNITQIGGMVINQLRDAVFAIESNIGLNAQGATASIANRLATSLDANGNILPSAIASAGLVSLPIVNSMISATAAIDESKLNLNYTTSYLNNFITNVNAAAQTGLSFISNHGFKLEPHIAGTGYNHYMNAILVAISSGQYFNNASGAVRNNTNLYTLFNDINDDLISHEVANGTPVSFIDGIQVGGTLPPTNYGHVSAGIYVNSSTFSFIPQTITDVQSLADFIDSSNILILGTRIQTLYANGVPINARAGALPNQNLGQLIIPQTNAQAYLLYGGANTPVDSIDHGDDLVEFFPSSASMSNNSFDASFNLVKPGDILTVDYDGYGNFTVQYVIREIKYSVSGGNKRYVVRIDGKNLINTGVLASINSPLFDNNKYGVLALAQCSNNSIGLPSSLIAGCPRGAEILGNGFDPDLINSSHYLLYLNVFPNGNPLNQVVPIPPIDISGNQGTTPGSYTLDGVVATINSIFRTPGFNNRFMAFQYNGNLGIKMTDSINNISFSIIDGIVNSSGLYDQALSNTSYPNNAIGVPSIDLVDPTGFGPTGSGVSSPAFSATYSSPQVALFPTKIWCPLSRKTFYVNGVERESFALEPFQLIDGYGDGYWPSTIITRNIIPGTRVEVTYQVPFDLATSSIEIGKTITAFAQSGGSFVDSGRFIISNIQFNNCASCGNPDIISTTNITVYDGVQSPSGNTPYASAPVGTEVFLYFTPDSISFSAENASDWTTVSPFKRHMEVYVDQDGYTFTQERGRLNISGGTITLNTVNGTVPIFGNANLNLLNIDDISSKLRGFAFGTIDKINLTITSYNQTTGLYSGYLCKWDGTTQSNLGPTTIGKRGNIVRFYDNTYVEYVDIVLNITDSLPTISSTQRIDIQLFPTLELDEEVMLLGTVQENTTDGSISWLEDLRQFGNVSVEQLTTSAINYIAAPTQLLNENGVIRGFNILSTSTGSGTITLSGGVAIVNGNIVQLDAEVINIPTVVEVLYPSFTTQISTITWYICVNQTGELQLIASSDFDPSGSTATTYKTAGLDQTRVFYVSNLTTGTVYPIRATYLSDLIFNNRDVCLLGIVSATVSGSPGSITSITPAASADARRFIGNGFSGFDTPFVLGPNANFTSFTALNNWLNQLVNLNAGFTSGQNNVGVKVLVKGTTNITSSTNLSFKSPVYFNGDGGIFNVLTNNAFTLGNNVSFDKITFNYIYDPFVSADAGYITSDLVNSQNALFYCSLATNTTNTGISITNCSFNWVPPTLSSTVVNRYAFISFQFTNVGQVLSNVNISNNSFNSTLANQPDIRAAIAFVSTITSAQAITAGLQMINCSISNNTCSQDQMILISSFLDGSLNLDCGITTVDTSIDHNICGTIGIITRYYEINDFTIPNTQYNGGKNQILKVSNNTCKMINSLTATGQEIFFTTGVNANMWTGIYLIEDNTTSWIRVLLNTSSSTLLSALSRTIIKNNFLSGYFALPFTTGPSFRSNYNALYGTTTSDNAAISVVNATFDGYASVIIDSNEITQGIYTTSIGGVETYGYDTGIITGHRTIISNNYISGLMQTISLFPPIGIQLVSLSCTLTNNHIIRAGTTISSYVDGGIAFFPNAHHLITNNFFDASTVDGSNIKTITNISEQTVAHTNINQVAYQAVGLVDQQNFILNPNGNGFTNGTSGPAFPYVFLFQDTSTNQVFISRVPSTTPPSVATAGYLKIDDDDITNSGAAAQRNFSFTVPIDTALPPGVKIVSATIGVFLVEPFGTVLDTSSHAFNQFSLTLVPYTNINNSGTGSPFFGIADVAKNLTSIGGVLYEDGIATANDIISTQIIGATATGGATTTEAALTAGTVFCNISTSLINQTDFTTTGKNNRIAASFDMTFRRSAGRGSMEWYISPILLAYQW